MCRGGGGGGQRWRRRDRGREKMRRSNSRIHLQVLNRSTGMPFERNLLPLLSMHDKILKRVRRPPRGF